MPPANTSSSAAGIAPGLAGPIAPEVIAIGPWQQREFAVARSAIDHASAWLYEPNVDAALRRLERMAAGPEVALLAQPYPGFCDAQAALRLERVAPLMRTIVVAGSWCEGEQRTGQPPLGAVRLYWHELAEWWRRACLLWAAGKTPPWSQPCGDSHWNGTSHWGRPDRVKQGGGNGAVQVWIAGNDAEAFDAYAAALAAPEVRFHRVVPVGDRWARQIVCDGDALRTVGIWDGGALEDSELQLLRRFVGAFLTRPAPVVALVDSPRPQDHARLELAGAAALLGKPLDVAILSQVVSRLGERSAVTA